MLPKPAHLGAAYAAQFADPSVVAAYPHRPPYSPAAFALLAERCAAPHVVLDIGCGPGDIARGLAPLVDRVDAVDVSAPMLALGQTLPGGNSPRVRWVRGRAEDVALAPPYGLVTAGESLHWMDWALLIPRLRRLLVPGGVIAIIDRRTRPEPWRERMMTLFPRYSTNQDFRPYDVVAELVQRRLYTPRDETAAGLVEMRQPVAAYVESFHSRNGLSRDRMTPQAAAAFDRELTELVSPFAADGMVTLTVETYIRWGAPCAE